MKAPLFELSLINDTNQKYNLESDIGNVIIITFWASWCPDCSVDLPKKEQLYKSMQNENVKMITINVSGRERDNQSAVAYANKFLTQLTLVDNGREVYDLYKCNGVPTTVIIDKFGNIFDQFDDKSPFMDIVTSIGKLIAD